MCRPASGCQCARPTASTNLEVARSYWLIRFGEHDCGGYDARTGGAINGARRGHDGPGSKSVGCVPSDLLASGHRDPLDEPTVRKASIEVSMPLNGSQGRRRLHHAKLVVAAPGRRRSPT